MNKIWLKIGASFILTGALVTTALIPQMIQKKEDNKFSGKVNLDALKNYKFKFNESMSMNYLGFKSIESTAKKVILDNNKNIDIDKINFTVFVGNENKESLTEEHLDKLVQTGRPYFVNKFTLKLESQDYDLHEIISFNNNFSLFDLEIMNDFYVYFNYKRPNDEPEKWVTNLLTSLNTFFGDSVILQKFSNELVANGFLTTGDVLKSNPFINADMSFVFQNQNLSYISGYSKLSFSKNDTNYSKLINYGIMKSENSTEVNVKYDVKLFQKKDEYHKKTVGIEIIDKGWKQKDRKERNDFLSFKYNDNTTIAEINKFLPTLFVRSEAYIHDSWFINPDNFKFSYWTTTNGSGRKYKDDDAIKSFWGYKDDEDGTLGRPYVAVQIDSIDEEYITYDSISFNVYFVKGGCKWDGGQNNGK